MARRARIKAADRRGAGLAREPGLGGEALSADHASDQRCGDQRAAAGSCSRGRTNRLRRRPVRHAVRRAHWTRRPHASTAGASDGFDSQALPNEPREAWSLGHLRHPADPGLPSGSDQALTIIASILHSVAAAEDESRPDNSQFGAQSHASIGHAGDPQTAAGYTTSESQATAVERKSMSQPIHRPRSYRTRRTPPSDPWDSCTEKVKCGLLGGASCGIVRVGASRTRGRGSGREDAPPPPTAPEAVAPEIGL